MADVRIADLKEQAQRLASESAAQESKYADVVPEELLLEMMQAGRMEEAKNLLANTEISWSSLKNGNNNLLQEIILLIQKTHREHRQHTIALSTSTRALKRYQAEQKIDGDFLSQKRDLEVLASEISKKEAELKSAHAQEALSSTPRDPMHIIALFSHVKKVEESKVFSEEIAKLKLQYTTQERLFDAGVRSNAILVQQIQGILDNEKKIASIQKKLNDQMEILSSILNLNIPVNERNQINRTEALDLATGWQLTDVMKILLKKGTDPAAQFGDEKTCAIETAIRIVSRCVKNLAQSEKAQKDSAFSVSTLGERVSTYQAFALQIHRHETRIENALQRLLLLLQSCKALSPTSGRDEARVSETRMKSILLRRLVEPDFPFARAANTVVQYLEKKCDPHSLLRNSEVDVCPVAAFVYSTLKDFLKARAKAQAQYHSNRSGMRSAFQQIAGITCLLTEGVCSLPFLTSGAIWADVSEFTALPPEEQPAPSSRECAESERALLESKLMCAAQREQPHESKTHSSLRNAPDDLLFFERAAPAPQLAREAASAPGASISLPNFPFSQSHELP